MIATAWNFYALSYGVIEDFPFYVKLVDDVYRELNVFKGGVYLDAGCGTGCLIRRIACEKGIKAYGVDFSAIMLKKATRNLKNFGNITLAWADLNRKLPFPDNFFDGIACVHTLYALENSGQTLIEFYRILKPGGKLVVADIKRGFTYKAFIPGFIEYIRKEKLEAFIRIMLHLPITATFNILQDIQMKKLGRNYPEKQTLIKQFKEAKFQEIKAKETYQNQSILISGKKPK